jgi:hypothetical protein
VAGRIAQDMLRIDGRELQMIITTDESLGNCPKVCAKYHSIDIVYYYPGYQISEEEGSCQVSGTRYDRG